MIQGCLQLTFFCFNPSNVFSNNSPIELLNNHYVTVSGGSDVRDTTTTKWSTFNKPA